MLMNSETEKTDASHTAVGELLLRTFGPVGDALAIELAKLPALATANLTRMVERVRARSHRQNTEEISTRLLHRILDEAAWSEHEVVAEYLSGVVASSGTRESNDRALGIVSLVQRLSAVQLRAHYLIYRELVLRAQPISPPGTVDLRYSVNRAKYHLEFGLAEFAECLGIRDQSKLAQRDILNHIVLGLAREEVVDHDSWGLVTDFWSDPSGSKERVSFHPTPLGAELFLWGCASPVTDQAQLFDPGLELAFELDVPRPRTAKLENDLAGEPMDLEEAVSLLGLEDAQRLEQVGKRMMASEADYAYGVLFCGFSKVLAESWEQAEMEFEAAALSMNQDQFERALNWFDFVAIRRPSHWKALNNSAAAFEVAYRTKNNNHRD